MFIMLPSSLFLCAKALILGLTKTRHDAVLLLLLLMLMLLPLPVLLLTCWCCCCLSWCGHDKPGSL